MMPRYEKLGLPSGYDLSYWSQIYTKAKEIEANGCTGVSEIYRDSCYEHDIHYGTGKTIYGKPLTRGDADAIFWERIVELSPLGVFSPVGWIRWMGVRMFGSKAWRG